ncbi:MAG: helix-turn-helix domain-containing protein [Clostridiales bacterium]|jgi:AraC family transcriptional regulator|nr:helix-turn-helix domain-containing protein [Clostridiales bacterium]
MKNFMVLTESINYIEMNLSEPIKRDDVSRYCFVSLSSLEKLFAYALGMSINTYITKRRMTQAAKDIAMKNISITDIAFKYQYSSVEVFSRAFKRVWQVNPSEFLANWNFTGIFPKINYNFKEGDDLYMARKKVDISESYDYMKSKQNSYVLCFDIQGLTLFNNISLKAGDLAILEMASRIDRYAADDMVILRIGGDEFALLTGFYSLDEAETLSKKILEMNGNPVVFEEQKLPLSLWCGITKIPESLRYDEFFMQLHDTINKVKS